MRFFDFLQDVTVVGVIVTLSFFLIDAPVDPAQAALTSDVAQAFDDPIAPSTQMIDDLIDSIVVDRQKGDSAADQNGLVGMDSLPADPYKAPAPLDLDELEKSLDRQLGIRKPSAETGTSSKFLPDDLAAIELPESIGGERAIPSDLVAPATPSRPVQGVNRGFDDTDLFDEALAGGTSFGDSLPQPTRRLGPVEILSPPSEY